MTAPDRPGTPDGRSAPETAGQALREDWFAVLAFAAYSDRPNASEAFAAWKHLSEQKRVNWRATVDAVRMAIAVPVVTPAPGQSAVLLDAAIWRAITESRDCQGARIPCRHCKRSATELRAVIDAHVAAAAPQVAPAIRAELEALAAFWVREYVTDDGWPQVCAKQLLDVLAGTEAAAHAAIAAAAPAPAEDGVCPSCGQRGGPYRSTR